MNTGKRWPNTTTASAANNNRYSDTLKLAFLVLPVSGVAIAQSTTSANSDHGRALFQQNCAVCHTDTLGPENLTIVRQGPSLVGVFGRRAGVGQGFNYTKSLKESRLTWDTPALDRFLTNPAAMVPGTTMAMIIPNASDRADVIAYLSSLKAPAETPFVAEKTPMPTLRNDPGDWRRAAPGVEHRITVAELPPPYSTRSAGNGPDVVRQPANAVLSVPPGFRVRLFAAGLSNPRLLRVSPNGDIFIAETNRNRIRVLRAADGAWAPSVNQIFVDRLDRPFGIAFYPTDSNPQWIYIANNNSVIRFPYQNGDLKARGGSQVVVPRLSESHGGHTTRDIAFSRDDKRMFISIGSASNAGEGMGRKSSDAIRRWEADRGRGAAWDGETDRADILVTDPEGHEPVRIFATGIRNGVGIAVDKETGQLWTSVNERDSLGDDLVPDYITRVKDGGFYGWPWYYLGNHEDPRLAGQRPDLASQVIVPDVLLQSHSASLEMTFYTATSGAAVFPSDYHGDIFAAFHGSWNRTVRTGYKVVRVRVSHGVPTGEYDDFLTGFVVDDGRVWGRPVGVAVANDGALLVTEDGNGTVWRVAYERSQR